MLTRFHHYYISGAIQTEFNHISQSTAAGFQEDPLSRTFINALYLRSAHSADSNLLLCGFQHPLHFSPLAALCSPKQGLFRTTQSYHNYTSMLILDQCACRAAIRTPMLNSLLSLKGQLTLRMLYMKTCRHLLHFLNYLVSSIKIYVLKLPTFQIR